MRRWTTTFLFGLTLAVGATACMPTLGARAGGALLTQPRNALGMSAVSVAVGTAKLPIAMGVGSVELGPYTHAYLVGAEFNLPFVRGVGPYEYPQVPWGRIRFDIGYRAVYDRTGATLGLAAGLGYPFLVIPSGKGDDKHVLSITLEPRVVSTQEVEFMGAIMLEYMLVPQRRNEATAQ